MKTRIALFASILMLSSLACSFASQLLGGDVPTEPVPTVDVEPVQPEPVQPEPIEAPTQVTNVLYEDDFSDTFSGWDRAQDEDSLTDYDNGAYRIKIDAPELVLWANPSMEGQIPSDVHIEVDVTNEGIDNNSMGIICRYAWVSNQPSFYRFLITSDGYYAIVLIHDGEQNVISSENKLLKHNAIKQGRTTNHITVECIGDQLTLYVNGDMLDQIIDSTLTDGDVGLIASTYEETEANLLFDNFIVTKP